MNIIDYLNRISSNNQFIFSNTYENLTPNFVTISNIRTQTTQALTQMLENFASAKTCQQIISREHAQELEHSPIYEFEEFFNDDSYAGINYNNIDELPLYHLIDSIRMLFNNLPFFANTEAYEIVRKIHRLSKCINIKIHHFINMIGHYEFIRDVHV